MKQPHDCEETLKTALAYLDQAFIQMPAVVREGSWGRRLQEFLDAALEANATQTGRTASG